MSGVLDEQTAALVADWPNSAFLRQVIADAYSHRETLTHCYWCSDCDKAAPQRCDDCKSDAEVMATYLTILEHLEAGAS